MPVQYIYCPDFGHPLCTNFHVTAENMTKFKYIKGNGLQKYGNPIISLNIYATKTNQFAKVS